MLDIISYILGLRRGRVAGAGTVVLTGDEYAFTDDGEGNITIEEAQSNGE